MEEEDILVVGQTASGEWPDPTRWMKGRNERTGDEGDFPGPYVEFVEEVTEEPEPPPVPRRVESHPVPPPRVQSTSSMYMY